MNFAKTLRQPAVKTRITSLLGCDYPVLLPGMSWISQSTLVAAVCNAGGVGILATGPLSPKETREEIRRIRDLTDKPFGIGATLLMPGAAENAAVALEEQAPIINTSLGKADWITQGVQSYGGKLISTVTTSKHAKAAIEAGADALLVTGHEAAAHGGDVTSLVLVPSLSERFPDTPIIAAGGWANGRGLAAALTLGADGVAMGSRLAVTKESSLAQAVKEYIANPEANEASTVYGSNFDGIPARVLKTPTSKKLMKSRPWFPIVVYRAFRAAQKMNVPLWKVLPGLLTQWDKMYMVAQFGAATESLTKATIDGNLKEGVQFIGQSAGLIHDVPHVEELMQRIIQEAREASQNRSLAFDSTTSMQDNNEEHAAV